MVNKPHAYPVYIVNDLMKQLIPLDAGPIVCRLELVLDLLRTLIAEGCVSFLEGLG
jgi:hypothetical protein